MLKTAKAENINILIEFITKRSANEFYEYLNNSGDIGSKNLRLLTGRFKS